MADTWFVHAQFSDLGAPPTRDRMPTGSNPLVFHGAVLGIFNDTGSGKVVRVKRLTLTDQSKRVFGGGITITEIWLARATGVDEVESNGRAVPVIQMDSGATALPSQVRVCRDSVLSGSGGPLERLRGGVFGIQNSAGNPVVMGGDRIGGGAPSFCYSGAVMGSWRSADTQSQVLREGEGMALGLIWTTLGSGAFAARVQVRVWLRVGSDTHLATFVVALDPTSIPYAFSVWNGVGSGVVVSVDRVEVEEIYQALSTSHGSDRNLHTVETTSAMIGGVALDPIPYDSSADALPSGIRVRGVPAVQQYGPGTERFPNRAGKRIDRSLRNVVAPGSGSGIPRSGTDAYGAPFGCTREQQHVLDARGHAPADSYLTLREGEGLAYFDLLGGPYGDWTVDLSFTIEDVGPWDGPIRVVQR